MWSVGGLATLHLVDELILIQLSPYSLNRGERDFTSDSPATYRYFTVPAALGTVVSKTLPQTGIQYGAQTIS